MNKTQLHKMKKITVIRYEYPMKNEAFIDKTKKQIMERFGRDALKDLIIDLDNRIVSFRDSKVPLVDDTKVLSTEKGIVTFRSKDYVFSFGLERSYGEIDAKKVIENGWILECYNGNYYKYEVVNE